MILTVLKGEIVTKQSMALIRTFRAVKDYIVDNQPLINQRDYLRLSMQVSDTQQTVQNIQAQLLDYCETPPIPVTSMERINSLLTGTRQPKIEELMAISEAYAVSINYLLTGDELFPSHHQLKKKDIERVMGDIERLKPETVR